MRLIENVLVIMIVVVALAMIVSYSQGLRFYIVRSGSMEPVIKTGSMEVVDTRYEYELIMPGDVICYETNNGTAVTHRVVNLENGMLETKGDANAVSDGFVVHPDNYVGKEIFAIPSIGYAAAVFYGVRGRIIIATVIIAIFILALFGTSGDRHNELKNGGYENEKL